MTKKIFCCLAFAPPATKWAVDPRHFEKRKPWSGQRRRRRRRGWGSGSQTPQLFARLLLGDLAKSASLSAEALRAARDDFSSASRTWPTRGYSHREGTPVAPCIDTGLTRSKAASGEGTQTGHVSVCIVQY